MPDASGKPYALVDSTKEGDWVESSGPPLLPQTPEGTVLQVYMTTGPSPRLAVMGPDGEHALAGELYPDGTYHGAISQDGTEYLGWYPSTAPATAAEIESPAPTPADDPGRGNRPT